MGRTTRGGEGLVQHFSHIHPLRNSSVTVAKQPNIHTQCCKDHRDYDSLLCCEPCNFFIHRTCSKLPAEINHPCHPEHTLTLLTQSNYTNASFSCDACGKPSSGFTYNCAACCFDLDTHCATIPQLIQNAYHLHPLYLTYRCPYPEGYFRCNICTNKWDKVWLYRCPPCQFDVHLDCIRANPTANQTLPPTVITGRQPPPPAVTGRQRPQSLPPFGIRQDPVYPPTQPIQVQPRPPSQVLRPPFDRPNYPPPSPYAPGPPASPGRYDQVQNNNNIANYGPPCPRGCRTQPTNWGPAAQPVPNRPYSPRRPTTSRPPPRKYPSRTRLVAPSAFAQANMALRFAAVGQQFFGGGGGGGGGNAGGGGQYGNNGDNGGYNDQGQDYNQGYDGSYDGGGYEGYGADDANGGGEYGGGDTGQDGYDQGGGIDEVEVDYGDVGGFGDGFDFGF